MQERWIVICKDEGQYALATRTAFQSKRAAEEYAKSISPSRDRIVVECGSGVDFRLAPRKYTIIAEPFEASDEKEAHKKAWESLTEDQRDMCECLDLVDVI